MRSRRPIQAAVLFGLCGGPGPVLALPDHTSYDIVLGQARKDQRRLNFTDEQGVSFPAELAIDRSHTPNHLYLADQGNSRVLGWRDVSRFRGGALPDIIIGQPDKHRGEWYRKDRSSLSGPTGIAVDKDGTVWVSDLSNGRVLGFRWPFDPMQSAEENTAADAVIGQPDFGIGFQDKGCNWGFTFGGTQGYATSSSLCNPAGLATDPSGNLYVADSTNSRVLLFRAPIPDKGAQAAIIFGQDEPKACTSNAQCTPQAPTCTAGFCRYTVPNNACNKGPGHAIDATTLCRPQGVFVHHNGGALQLYVADSGNNRVLVYDSPLTSQTATRVFGQPSMTSVARAAGPDRLNNPIGVSVDAQGVVWISDGGNNRLLGFQPPFGASAGLGASYVIGQLDANGVQPNQGVAGRATTPPGPGTLFAARRAIFDGDRMLIPDSSNHRVLGVSGYTLPSPSASLLWGQPDFSHGAENFTQAQGLAYPAGVAVDRPDPARRPGEPIHVYVADFFNSRVLGWWDLGSLANGKPADIVIGQRSMGDYACNGGRGVSPKSLCWPRGVFVDKEGDLWVADTWNHRVVRFARPFAGPLYPAANLVLGQSDMLSSLPNQNGGKTPSATSLWHPSAVAVGEDGIAWVADRDNDRVLGYLPPFKNGMEAGRLLQGQDVTGYNSTTCPVRPRADHLCGPTALALDQAGNLWVAERDNHRVSLYSTTPLPGSHVLSSTALAILGQTGPALVGANGGTPATPRATTLRAPEGVSVELVREMDGTLRATGIVVADSGNNRVLTYAPITTGYAPAATMVFGQDGRFDLRRQNSNDVFVEDVTNVERGLWNPGAVMAIPEALFISDSGNTSYFTTRSGHVQPTSNSTGNNRVLLVKGPNFPEPSSTPWSAPDGGVEPEPDLLPPEELVDLTPPEPPDMRAPPPPDLAQVQVPQPGGCTCRVGGGAEPVLPLLCAVVLGGALLRRRRPRA